MADTRDEEDSKSRGGVASGFFRIDFYVGFALCDYEKRLSSGLLRQLKITGAELEKSCCILLNQC